jgi:outer membrane lipoprotein-sorting protein
MKSASRLAAVLVLLLSPAFFTLGALAQEGPLDPSQPKSITPDEIIQRFAAKEKEFKEARDQYTYRQEVKVETVDGNTVTGEYQEVFDVLFDDKGKRLENVVFAPQSTLENGGISMTKEDLSDIRNRLPFVLTSDEIPEYSILYKGQQQEDELHCYVFDIAPKAIEKDKRYFQGRVWVDDHDFQIVKTYGKTVPDIRTKKGENLFPKFTTWREQIDGRYWFPTYTRADDTLNFSMQSVHIREIVKYTNYKKFGSNVRITYDGKELPKDQQKAPQQQTPQQPPQ